MQKEKFFEDLSKVYQIIKTNQDEINSFYEILSSYDSKKSAFIDDMIQKLGLTNSKTTKMAVISRVVNLRSDALKQTLEKEGFSTKEIETKLELAYDIVSDFYIKKFQDMIEKIEEKNLLTPFYREIFKGVHEVGKEMTKWQTKWTNHIIYTINRDLFELFDGDDEKIFEMLVEKNLLDLGHKGEIGDRSYSALTKNDDGEFEVGAYCNVFENEVKKVVKAIDNFIENLKPLEDETFGEKENFINYLLKIKEAFLEEKRHSLIEKWANVDRAWMKIKAPLQIGHPLEYYEDHYRKAVALEWDLRIVNPKTKAGEVIKDIKNMYESYMKKLKNVSRETEKIYNTSLKSLNKIQLYLGRPALFYGAEFDGLFSAQVVPNDEVVSSEEGKKIFAFADNVYESAKAKPFLKIHSEIFPADFLDKNRRFLFQMPKEWHQVYNITTIGHEYGHILWIDDDTEAIMNKSGAFKNVEEFKATTGGLVAFFENEDKKYSEWVIEDVIKRAVGLISWRETGEVQPYYCEGLIHLQGLFETKVLEFDKKLSINYQNYPALKEWYKKTYKELATFYLLKKDANEFLKRFAKKVGTTYDPVDDKVRYFVNYYWKLYKEIGQVIDDTIKKEDYLLKD